MKRSTVVLVAAVAVTALALSACTSDKTASPSGTTNRPNAAGGLTVHTSKPLQDIVSRLVKGYTTNHPQAKITVDPKATPTTLKASVNGGQPQVIVYYANPLKKIADLETKEFGRNLVVIAVSTKNPKKIKAVEAFAATSGNKVRLCGKRTGFGNTALWAALKAKVKVDPAKIGADCEAEAMEQVAKGELDAALMFRNGIRVPKGVKLIEVSEKQNIIFPMSYAAIGASADAKGFAAFLASEPVRKMLTLNGYLP